MQLNKKIGFTQRMLVLEAGIVCAGLLALTPCTAAASGAVTPARAGHTIGTFAVDAIGEANYTIPVWAPPGPNGLQPNIALAYNSSQGDGYVGVGWGVAGLSSITRCNRTEAQDGTTDSTVAVTLTTNDAFCLDGQRLQVTSGTNGADGSTYQTEIATSQNVIAHGVGSITNGPAYFVVQAPNGTQYEYGNTGSSEVMTTPNSSTVLFWMLDKVTDAAGNTMTYSYTTANGTTVPATISWTPTTYGSSQYSYSMVFTYTTNNPQTSPTRYIGGVPVSNTNLLTSIAISTPGNGAVLKQYNLYYGTSSATQRNELTQVQECADSSNNYCLGATTASYQTAVFGLSTTAIAAVAGSVQTAITNYDFNNDGIPDILYYSGGTWYVAFGSPSGYGTPINTGITTANLIASASLSGASQDGVLAQNGSTWSFYSWNGSSFTGVSTGIPVDSSGMTALLDVNGDGLPDFVSFYPATNTTAAYITTRLNTSTGGTVSFNSSAPVSFTDPGGPSSSSVTKVGVMYAPSNYFPNPLRSWDFNGDGLQDLFYIGTATSCVAASQGICTQWQTVQTPYTLLGQPNGNFSAVAISIGGSTGVPQMVNWNNDKCTDMVVGSTVYVSACNGAVGTSFSLQGPMVATMDVDGDGRTDAIIEQGNTLYVQLSTGNGVNNTPQTLGISALSSGPFGRIDVDGSGLDELACIGCAANEFTYYARNSPGTIPDLLTQVSDWNGNSVQPSYASIAQSQNSHYTAGATGEPVPSGYAQFNAPLYVVTQATYSDPSSASGATYQKTYSYADAWTNTQGRGFVGFGTQQVCDSRLGIWETWSYSHDSRGFPYVGMLTADSKTQSESSLCSAQGKNVFNVSHTPAAETLDSNLGAQRFLVYSSQDIQTAYEVGGSKTGEPIKTKSISYGEPDSYGNFSSITTVTTDVDGTAPVSPTFQQSWTTEITNQYQSPNLTVWCVNLIGQSVVSQSSTVGATVTRETVFSPDSNASACRNITATHVAQTSGYNVIEAFGYDNFGNINSDTLTGAGIVTRQTTANWGTTGQFPVSRTDASGARTQYAYTPAGNVTSVTDPNGVLTQYAYTDGFWRLTQITRADGTSSQYLYQDCAAKNACLFPGHAVYTTRTDYGNGGSQLFQAISIADSVDRPLMQTAPYFSGISRNEVRYDSSGRVAEQAAPCTWVSPATTCTSWTTNTYDLRNRVVQTQLPSGGTTAYNYAGYTTSITDANGHTRTLAKDPNGWLRETVDAYTPSYTVYINYDAAGNKTSVTDSTSVQLWKANSYIYGIRAFLSGETDLYRGTWSYTPDALGNITSWTDPKNQTFFASYDALSRMTSRTEPDLFTQWTWGTGQINGQAAYNLGQLQAVCTGTGASPMACNTAGYAESETYDSLGRQKTRAIQIPGDTTYTYGFAYDSTTGLPGTLTYPTTPAGPALQIQYNYNAGQLQSITDLTDSLPLPLWTVNSENPTGQVTLETLGNDVQVNHSFDPVSGLPTEITVGEGGGATLQNESFLFDQVGNLTQREDNKRGFIENITPDADNRISTTTINSNADMTVNYYPNGSIRTVQFAAAPPSTDDYQSPNSLVAENSNALGGGTVTWTSFNQPSIIPGPGSSSSTLLYDHNHQRWQQQANYSGSTETTTYIGGLLEKVATSAGTVYRHYIPVGNITVMYLPSGTSPTINYITADHLASTATITDQSGNLIIEESFSPWGARRDPNNWTEHQSAADAALLATTMRYGFTDQEHLDNLGLIDMNGRMYQGTGFMSPDPRLQDPSNTQNYNRYAYVNNNPLSLVDPTGFDDENPGTADQNCFNQECGTPLPAIEVDCNAQCRAQYTQQLYLVQLAEQLLQSELQMQQALQQFQTQQLQQVLNLKINVPPCSRLSSLDSTIQQVVNQYNSDNGFSQSDAAYLDPTLVEAMVAVESGFNSQAYSNDPMQVNNAGDWDPQKATIAGLTQGQAPGQAQGIESGIAWLTYKAYAYNSAGVPVAFRGWPSAVTRYNGGGDPNYLSKVLAAQSAIAQGCQ